MVSPNIPNIGTADICDKYGDRLQVVRPILKLFGGHRSCSGSIATIRLNEEASHLRRLLQTPGKGRVLVVDANDIYCAVLGGALAEFAVKYDWRGLIINGYIRDTATINTVPIPVWARGICPRRSTKSGVAEHEIDLVFGDVRFRPGNFIYADQDGVIVCEAPFPDIRFSD